MVFDPFGIHASEAHDTAMQKIENRTNDKNTWTSVVITSPKDDRFGLKIKEVNFKLADQGISTVNYTELFKRLKENFQNNAFYFIDDSNAGYIFRFTDNYWLLEYAQYDYDYYKTNDPKLDTLEWIPSTESIPDVLASAVLNKLELLSDRSDYEPIQTDYDYNYLETDDNYYDDPIEDGCVYYSLEWIKCNDMMCYHTKRHIWEGSSEDYKNYYSRNIFPNEKWLRLNLDRVYEILTTYDNPASN